MTGIVEVRCPNGPQRLFTKLRLAGETARYIERGNLIEFPCADCRRRETEPVDVFHRYNFAGDLVETVKQPRDA